MSGTAKFQRLLWLEEGTVRDSVQNGRIPQGRVPHAVAVASRSMTVTLKGASGSLHGSHLFR